MAHTQIEGRPPLKAASAMRAYAPIAFVVAGAGGSVLSETVLPAGSFNDFAFGITSATVASAGDPVSYWSPHDVGKGIAAASLGAGAFVVVGSSNGVLIPLTPSWGASVAAAAAPRYRVGIALKNAVAGDFFPVYISPQQLL